MLCKVNCKHGTSDGKHVDVTSRNVTLWQMFPQFFGIKDQNNFKIRRNVRKKAYNKHIIIIVTWFGVQYHISWMRPYNWITLDATRLGVIRWYDLIHSTWYSTPDQVTIMIICIYTFTCMLVTSQCLLGPRFQLIGGWLYDSKPKHSWSPDALYQCFQKWAGNMFYKTSLTLYSIIARHNNAVEISYLKILGNWRICSFGANARFSIIFSKEIKT